VSIRGWRGTEGGNISQFPENGRSSKAKRHGETVKNRGEVLSYGHVYQFSFYIKLISTADPMMICGPLTGNMATTSSATIPTVAEICVRVVSGQTSNGKLARQ
jgi:hypothetical protein